MRIALPSLSVVLALAGCGAATASSGTTVATAHPRGPSRLHALEERNAALERDVRELEARLALSQAEARELGDRLDAQTAAAPIADVVRIGASSASPAEADGRGWVEAEPDDETEPDDGRPRPLLRLYGVPGEAPAGGIRDAATVPPIPLEPLVLPPAPPGVPTRLPVAAYPEAPVEGIAPVASSVPGVRPPLPGSPPLSAAIESYRQALGLVRDRRYPEARAALDAWLAANPSHPYAPSAVYWRGEVLYALHEYAAARAEFERVVERWPRAGKVADALFKIGMCHLRMGDDHRARAYFARVRREHPDSVAARLSAQEDAT